MRKSNTNIKTLAYHEAGHAIVCFEMGIKFKHVSILTKENENVEGHVLIPNFNLATEIDFSDKLITKAEKYICICFAGLIAEKKFTGKSNYRRSRKDLETANLVASSLWGSDKVTKLHLKYLFAKTEAIFEYLDYSPKENTEAWNKVEKLANLLLEKKYIKYSVAKKLI